MARILIYIIGAIVVSIVALFFSPPDGATFAITTGLAVAFIMSIVDSALANLRNLRIAFYSLRTWRETVRVSASYLYRIRVGNEYLLIKSARFDHFQPVGGVYKFHASSAERRRDLQILDDDLLVPDEVSEGDLRVRLPGRNLLSFVRWFEEGRGREVDGWREFYEELVGSGILPSSAFKFVKYDVVRRYYHPLRYSPWAECKELLIADVIELIPTPEQTAALEDLKRHPDPRVLWATEDRIRRLGARPGESDQQTRIGGNAVWTI